MSQCFVRNSTNWASNPQLQLAYQAQKQWGRLNCPGAILGVYTTDELEEGPKTVEATVKPLMGGKATAVAPVASVKIEDAVMADGATTQQNGAVTPHAAEPTVEDKRAAFNAFMAGCDAEKVVPYLVSIKFIEETQGYGHVSDKHAALIMAKQASFKKKIAEFELPVKTVDADLPLGDGTDVPL